RRRRVHRGRASGRRGWVGARPAGRLRAGRPLAPGRPRVRPDAARARGARADGGGPLQPGHLPAALHLPAGGREARDEHLRQARPAVGARRPPSRARGAALPQVVATRTRAVRVASPADTSLPYSARGAHRASCGRSDLKPHTQGDEMRTLVKRLAGADRRWVGLAVIVTAQFMVVLDVAIVNVALPTIKTDLGFSESSLQWVVTAYSILFGGMLLLGGRLADLLGRRRLFMTGLAIFTAASLLDGLAWSEGSLIAFRSLQGLGAALVSPAALSILTTTFDEGRDRNRALGIWGAVSGSGGAAGVLLGGALTSSLSWSWIFFINVPVGVAVLALAVRFVNESRAEVAHRHFDLPGATSITTGVMVLVYAMTRAVQHGWETTETITLLAVAAILIVAFVEIESRSS